MAEAKRRVGLRTALGDVLAPCVPLRPHNLALVILTVKGGVSFHKEHIGAVRNEFLALVGAVDQRLPAESVWQNVPYTCAEFANYPNLGRYIRIAQFLHTQFVERSPISRALDQAMKGAEICRLYESWIRPANDLSARSTDQAGKEAIASQWFDFASDGGAYSSETAINVNFPIVIIILRFSDFLQS